MYHIVCQVSAFHIEHIDENLTERGEGGKEAWGRRGISTMLRELAAHEPMLTSLSPLL